MQLTISISHVLQRFYGFNGRAIAQAIIFCSCGFFFLLYS